MNESRTEDIVIQGVGTITHPENCVCAGDCCELEDDE